MNAVTQTGMFSAYADRTPVADGRGRHATFLLVPGLHDSDAGHWQTIEGVRFKW